MDPSFMPYREAAAYLKSQLKETQTASPEVGIICGSGLSGLASTMEDRVNISYSAIPGFPSCTVSGHAGEVSFGNFRPSDGVGTAVPAMCFRGRFHSYEGHDMNVVVLPVRVMRCLGVKVVLVTNSTGGLNSSYAVGDFVSIMDHIAFPMLAGKNPLVGSNDAELGPRFPSTSDAYDPVFQEVVVKAAKSLGYDNFLRTDGTYCFVSGPMYESKAECRFLRSAGGDVVGMSTVPEVVAAHHCGLKVICLSLVTNKVIFSGNEQPAASHAEVLETATMRAEQMRNLVNQIIHLLQIRDLPDLPPVTLPE